MAIKDKDQVGTGIRPLVVDALGLHSYSSSPQFAPSSDFSAFIAGIGSTPSHIIIGRQVVVSVDMTIPSNITLEVLNINGGAISVSAGKILTHNGNTIAGIYKIFSGSGTVLLSGREDIEAAWFGAVADGATDDQPAIQKAINAAPTTSGCTIQLHKGTYAIASGLTVNSKMLRIQGDRPGDRAAGSADATSVCCLKYTGALNNAAVMISVQTLAHNFSIANIFLDANDLAGYCLWHYGISSPAGLTRGGEVRAVAFQGYRTVGWVLGDDTDVLNDTQFQNINAYDLNFLGGATSRNAVGIHLNAQNCEWLNIYGMYVDPSSTFLRHHKNHIRQISGGLNITGLLTTRAGTTTLIADYAIHSQDQLVINGWRSEDRFMINKPAVTCNAPSFVSAIHQRVDDFTGLNVTDHMFSFATQGAPVFLASIRTIGSIYIGATDLHKVVAQGIEFERAGSTFIFGGAENAVGIYHDTAKGAFDIRGSAPQIDFKHANGDSLFSVKDGSLFTPAISPTQLTGSVNDYDLGAGVFFRLSSDSNYNITGLAGGAAGRRLVLVQTSAFSITLKHQSGSSVNANKILSVTGLDIIIAQNEVAELIWDASTNRWRAWKVALMPGTLTGALTITGLLTLQNGLNVSGGNSVQGAVITTAINGLVLRGYTGSSNDFGIRSADDTPMLVNPVGTTVLTHKTRVSRSKGSNVTAANDLILGAAGNVFTITGNTQINGIEALNWQTGSDIILIFSGTPTVKHNTAASAGFASFKLQGSVDLVCAADTVLCLVYDGTVWHETKRKTA